MCASKPPAIDLGLNIDPPLFGVYHTEPGYYIASSFSVGRKQYASNFHGLRLTLSDPVA